MPPAWDAASGTFRMCLLKREAADEDEVNRVTCFDTGLSLSVPEGRVVVVTGTSSLLAHGYMLASGVQLCTGRGPLTLSLYKFREGPDLELPYECLQALVVGAPAAVFHQKALQPGRLQADPLGQELHLPPSLSASRGGSSTLS